MTSAYELLKAAQQTDPGLIEAVEILECRFCGYAEYACCCDFLCFWREYPGCPPCLEPKESPADETCRMHREDYLRDRAIDIFGSAL